MAQWRDFPLPDGSYSDETRPWSQQDVVNYLPTIAERNGTRSPVLHKTAPGMKVFARIGDGPHRGAHNCEGRRLVVSGRKLYQVTPAGGATELGTIPGTGRVTMAHNQIANGNQVLIGTVDNSYLWDTTTSTLAATGVALQSVDFLNQRFLGVDQQRRFWRHSALADGTSWNDLDVYSSESSPDRIVGLKVLDGQVYVFNERTIEVFVDQPTETQVYQRSVVIQRGCISGDSIVRIAGTLFFVGDDYIPYRLDGYTPVPIGPKPITSDLSGTDPRKLFGSGWEDRGYLVYYITAQNGHTWGYDVTSGRWHRRESYGLDRWRINTLVKFEQDWYAGDYSSNLMYKLDWGYVYEGCEIMPRGMRTGVLHNAGNRVTVHGLRLSVATGQDAQGVIRVEGPTITGSAPDGIINQPYTFSYTMTPGDAPIVGATINESDLLAGLEWDEATATISGTPTETGSMTLTPHAFDTNALWDSLTDTILVTEHWGLLVTGDAAPGHTETFAFADATDIPEFELLPTASGADIAGGIPYYYSDRFVVAGSSTARMLVDGDTAWTTVTSARGANSSLVGGPHGWAFLSSGGALTDVVRALVIGSGFTEFDFPLDRPLGTQLYEHAGYAAGLIKYTGGYYWIDCTARGYLGKSDTLDFATLVATYARDEGNTGLIAFYDIEAHDGKLLVTGEVNVSSPSYALRESSDSGVTFATVLKTFVASGAANTPFQICSNGTVALVVSADGATVWSSADGYATGNATGLSGTFMSGGNRPAVGRMIIHAASRFYLIDHTHIVSTLDGITFTEPVAHGVINARGIAAKDLT